MITNLPTEIIQKILDLLPNSDLLNAVSSCSSLNVFPMKRWKIREQVAFSKKSLIYWVRCGNLKAVKFLCTSGTENPDKDTLMWACCLYKFDIIKYLIEETKTPLTVTALYWIAPTKVELLDYLYTKLAPLEYENLNYLLLTSVIRGDIVLLCYFHEIAKVAIPVESVSLAIECGKLSVLKYLHEVAKLPISRVSLTKALQIGNYHIIAYLKDCLKISNFETNV